MIAAACWRLRRGFWTTLSTFKFRKAKPMVVPCPPDSEPALRGVPLREKFPDVPITKIDVADHVPPDEAQRIPLVFCRFQGWLNATYPPSQPGLAQVAANPYDALVDTFSRPFRRCVRAPVRPVGLEAAPDLGTLAVMSPYACYLRATGPGAYEWDLTELRGHAVAPGALNPWARVSFSVDPETRRPVATQVECEYGSVTPASSSWGDACRLATCSVTNHLSLVRHWNWLHLVFGGPLAIATRNCLPGRHPVRRLVHPHVFATQSSNEFVTYPQMNPGGDFESVFSFSHDGVATLLEATRDGFDLRMVNPVADVAWRGVRGVELDTPAFDNRTELLGVLYRHAERYLRAYYDDDTIASDAAVCDWIAALAPISPQGTTEIVGSAPSVHGVAALCATIIYMASVEHEIVDAGMWDYQLWPDANPTRVFESGRRPTRSEYFRTMLFNFNFQTPRTQLMDDFSGLALDYRGAAAFVAFREDLARLQAVSSSTPWEPWRIVPQQLKANINA